MSRTLFGAPTRLDPVEQQRWIRLLNRNWVALMGRPAKALEPDLKALEPIFSNRVSPKTIKSRIYELPEADPDSRMLPAEVAIVVDGCALITPEGRILLDVLLDLSLSGGWEIDFDKQVEALSTATTLRGRWHAEWLHKQFDSTISAPVLGAALFLLVNGSVGEKNALLLPADVNEDRELGSVVMPLVAGFSESLRGRIPATDSGIRQHWAFTQVSRLLGRDVAREQHDRGTSMFVREGRQTHLIDTISERLETLAADTPRRYVAVMNFLNGYRQNRGLLAAMGQMHEDPTTTRRIADRLVSPGAAL